MQPLNAALLINLLGFSVGIALYALLAAMVVRHRSTSNPLGVDTLLLTTAALGLIWNIGELFLLAQNNFGTAAVSPVFTALAFSALGFLPSVVGHSTQSDQGRIHWLIYVSYGLSCFAAVLHFQAALVGEQVPSATALTGQTAGSIALILGLLIFNLKQTLEKKAIWATALLIFALSALHLGGETEGKTWYVELIAHQSSLPLALAILYQNYRFAFADLFLKRAISLLLLAASAFALYLFVAVPLIRYQESINGDSALAAALILGLWVVTALFYSSVYSFAAWVVDRVILKRADYGRLQNQLVRDLEEAGSIEAILDGLCSVLSSALTVDSTVWKETRGHEGYLPPLAITNNGALLRILTAEQPHYEIEMSGFTGGRRLLSEEVALLEGISLAVARRIDVIRVAQERFDREFREQEFAKLAVEAQVAALRSQINPHFLFNALTTLGYLIKTSPEKAYDTLMRLTQLLRGVLRSTGEFSTLGDEIDLIESYLDIERARFEEKLSVRIDIENGTKNIKVPSLILQPLVENAIKHGISENKKGGEINISAKLVRQNGNLRLRMAVWDSGAGASKAKDATPGGLGLANIRGRIGSYYGGEASLNLEISNGNGTEAVIILPADKGRK